MPEEQINEFATYGTPDIDSRKYSNSFSTFFNLLS
jgi:hypothetical protein